MKHPRLTTRGCMFWIRAKVPADLKAYYAPKTEIISSLKTSDPREALEKVRIASVQIDQEFNTARRKLNAELRVSLSDKEIERLAAIHLHTLMEEDEELRMEGANKADLYASVAKQVKAVGGVAALTDERTRAECGFTTRQDRYAEAMEPLGLVRGQRQSRAHHEPIRAYYARLRDLEAAAEAERLAARQDRLEAMQAAAYAADLRQFGTWREAITRRAERHLRTLFETGARALGHASALRDPARIVIDGVTAWLRLNRGGAAGRATSGRHRRLREA